MKRVDYLKLTPDAPIGVRIWYMREKRGMTQAQLAKKAYMQVLSVRNWELMRFTPRACYIPALAAALGVSTEWLMTGEESVNG